MTSVNLNLGVVRGYCPERAEAIERAVREVLVRAGIGEDLPPLTVTTDAVGRYLTSQSARPVSITGVYGWAMRVEKELREAAVTANGRCGTG